MHSHNPRPQPDQSDLRQVQPSDVDALANACARAFYGNPGMGWTFRNDDTRLAKLERGFAMYFRRLWLPRGECYTAEDLAGAAIWMPPGGWEIPAGLQLRLLPHIARIVRGETLRMLRFYSLIERKHPREPHWYLLLLGIAPEHQGRGFGSHLMRPVLERCDREGIPAYLETDTERNVDLYRRHGFDVTEEFPLPGGGPPIWLMWREASPPRPANRP